MGRCRACNIFHQYGIFSNAFDLIPWNNQVWFPAKQAEKAWSAKNDKGTNASCACIKLHITNAS